MDTRDGRRWPEQLRQERILHSWSQQDVAEQLGTTVLTIKRWERGSHQPGPYFRLKLCALFGKSVQELGLLPDASPHSYDAEIEAGPLVDPFPPSSHSSTLWSIPYPRNPFFTGREEILRSLHTLLSSQQLVALTQSAALSGMGGIGKTQVAIEYAYRYAQEYYALFWLAAETSESLLASMQHIADQLQLIEREAAEQSRMVAAIQRWLLNHPGWLLIADNVEDLDLLQTVLPPVRRGALLLTTRRQALGTLAHPLELQPMNSEEGVTLVLRRSRWLTTPIKGDAAPQERGSLDPIPAEAVELVTYLEGLPLALDQAGAYIEETGCNIANYLQLYHDQRKQVLARRGTHMGAHPASVAATLKLSIQQVEREHPATADLLRVCAFLHPEAIPEELFHTRADHLGPRLSQVAADSYQFDLALATLRSASLVTRHTRAQSISIHRLVQVVLRDEMEPGETRLWSEQVIRAVNAAFPQPPFDAVGQREQCERYLTHALACVPLIAQIESSLTEASELLYKAGSYLLARTRNEDARLLLERAVALGEQQYGSNHSALIPLLSKQASILWFQGNYKQAESILRRALTLGEQHLGPMHPQIVTILVGLADAVRDGEHYEQAELLYQRALCMSEELQGPEHPEVAEVLDCFAVLYWNQGKYEQAEPLYQRAIRIQDQHLGPEHPRTAITLYNLATLYRDQGKYEQAEPLYQRVLSIREQRSGPDHLGTATALHGLATVYLNQGKYEQAEPLYQRSLRIREQQEPEHTRMATTLNCLATLYREQGKYEQAEPLYQRALRIREQRLGSEHPDTAMTLGDLAMFYHKQQKYHEAGLLYQRALSIGDTRPESEYPGLVSLRRQYRLLLQAIRSEDAPEQER